MVSEREIKQRADEMAAESGMTLDYALELAAAELDPSFSDCGPGMSNAEASAWAARRLETIIRTRAQTATAAD